MRVFCCNFLYSKKRCINSKFCINLHNKFPEPCMKGLLFLHDNATNIIWKSVNEETSIRLCNGYTLKKFFLKEWHTSDLEKRLVKQICHWDYEPVPYTSRHAYTCIYPTPKYCFPFSICCYTRGRILQQEANYLNIWGEI